MWLGKISGTYPDNVWDMTNVIRNRWTLLFLVQLCVGSATLSARADEKISPEARAYFKNGVELLQNDPPNYQDAFYQFKLAYEKSQSWKVLGNYGLCALKLERDGEAVAFYEEYLQRGGKQINEREREGIERDMLLVKGNGATLELSSKIQTLTIQDSRAGSAAAAQTYDLTGGTKRLFVRAGSHRLAATTQDGRTLTWEVILEPGRTVSHEFDFDAPAATATPPVAATTPATGSESAPSPLPRAVAPVSHANPLRTVGFVTAGVGVLALGGGAITGLMSKSKESAAKDKCDPVTKNCDLSAQPLFDDASSFAKTATVLFIGGGVLTAAGIGMIVLGHPTTEHETPAARLSIVPLFAGNAGGFVAAGSF